MKLTSAEELKQLIAIASLKWTLNDSPENTANLLGEIRQIQANAIRAVLGIGGASDISPSVRRLIETEANQLDPLPEAKGEPKAEPDMAPNEEHCPTPTMPLLGL